MNRLIKSSIYGSTIITLLYLVLFYPLILIHKFDWYDLLLVSLSISPGIFIMIFIYNLDEDDQEPLWLLALCFIFGAINLHLDVDIHLALPLQRGRQCQHNLNHHLMLLHHQSQHLP